MINDYNVKIQVEAPGNPDCRAFYVNRKISDKYEIFFDDESDIEDKEDKLGSIAVQLIKKIFSICGVNNVSINDNKISVFRAKNFEWDILIPKIANVITNVIEGTVSEIEQNEDEAILSITTEAPGNPECRIFNINRKISNMHESFDNLKYIDDHKESLGLVGTQLVEKLFSINGIHSVSIDKYDLTIIKGKNFKWETLKPLVINVITNVIEGTNNEIEEHEEALSISIIAPPNDSCRCFHINRKVSEGIEMFDSLRFIHSDRKKVGFIGAKIVTELFSISGVNKVTINKYEISILKAKCFEWDILIPKIKNVITNILEGTNNQLEKDKNETELSFIVETAPNPNYIAFHMNEKLCDISIETFSNTKYLGNHEDLGHLGIMLIKRLFYIDGIDEIVIQRYKLSIKKGHAFDWENLIPQIKNTIRFTIEENRMNKEDQIREAMKILKK